MQPVKLTTRQIESALPRVSVGLDKYVWLQSELRLRDVSKDDAYQKKFGGFYRVRRNSEWRTQFYQILERGKSTPTSFGDALTAIQGATGRVEASFASKLAATLDPTQPVIDSIVLGNLRLKLPAASSSGRIVAIRELHERLVDVYASYLASESGRDMVKRFRHAYPSARISEVKMLDLVLWQSRTTA